MKYLPILLLAVLVGCSSNPPQPTPESVFSEPPHLWSGQKAVDQTPDSCAANGVKILKALSFVSVVKNGSYVYGTLLANRAAIKCVPNGEKTFVYAAVAGPEKKQVERLRMKLSGACDHITRRSSSWPSATGRHCRGAAVLQR